MKLNIIIIYRIFCICLLSFMLLSCSKESKHNQDIQTTNRFVHKNSSVNKKLNSSFHITTESNLISNMTFADKDKITKLTKKFIEEYQNGGGRSAKVMETINFYRDLLTNNLIDISQKLLMVQDWNNNHLHYLGAQGSLFYFYSKILENSNLTIQDKNTALIGCADIYSSFYYDKNAVNFYEKALKGYQKENDYFHKAETLEKMAEIYAEHQNDEEQALTLFQQALKEGKRVNNYNILPLQINIIQCLTYLHKLDDAEDFVNEILVKEPDLKEIQEKKTYIEMLKGPPTSQVFRGVNIVTIFGADIYSIPGFQDILNEKNNLKTREFLRQMLNTLIKIETKEAP